MGALLQDLGHKTNATRIWIAVKVCFLDCYLKASVYEIYYIPILIWQFNDLA